MRAIRISALIVAVAVASAGCGGGEDRDGDRPAEGSGSDEALEGAGESQPAAGALDDTAPDPSSQEDEAGDALASREGQIDGDAVRLDITELRRSGSTTALTFELTVGEPRAG